MQLEAAIKKIRNRAKAVNREVVIDLRDHHDSEETRLTRQQEVRLSGMRRGPLCCFDR